VGKDLAIHSAFADPSGYKWLYWTEVQDCYHVSFPTEFFVAPIYQKGEF